MVESVNDTGHATVVTYPRRQRNILVASFRQRGPAADLLVMRPPQHDAMTDREGFAPTTVRRSVFTDHLQTLRHQQGPAHGTLWRRPTWRGDQITVDGFRRGEQARDGLRAQHRVRVDEQQPLAGFGTTGRFHADVHRMHLAGPAGRWTVDADHFDTI